MPKRIITINDYEAQKEAKKNRSIEIDSKFDQLNKKFDKVINLLRNSDNRCNQIDNQLNEFNKKLDKIIDSKNDFDEVEIKKKIDELYEKLKYEAIMHKCDIKKEIIGAAIFLYIGAFAFYFASFFV